MRRSNSALPAKDACRAWSQAAQQRRVLTSAAAYSGYIWPASNSATASSSSSALPLSFTFYAGGPSSAKAKPARRSRSLFAFSYSTSNPAYPLPGSNNEIDPRGVDYSLFEAEDDTYGQHASTSTITGEVKTAQHDEVLTAAPSPTNAAFSAPTQLLVRLINGQEFEAATTVLNELKTLKSPLEEPLPIYATAALWAIRNGKKKDMLSWMRLCPGYIPGTKYLNTASSTKYTTQVRSTANQFRKCFMVLLDSYGDDLRLLQQASMIAAQKGLWGVLQSTLAQILRFGIGRMPGSDASSPAIAWQYFHRLLLANQSQRGLKEEGRRQEILSATVELRGLYNLGIRTLALAGRLDDAVHWAEKSAEVTNAHSPLAQILVAEPFTENLLVEELVKAGSDYVDNARELAERLADSPSRLFKQRPVNVDAVVARVEREAAFRIDESEHQQSALDSALQTHLEQGDVMAAREYLLSVLRSVTRVRIDEAQPYIESLSDQSTFDHLPSARVLSEVQDVAHKLGTIPVTSSLTETDMRQSPDAISEEALTQETLTAEELLRPIRVRLSSVRGGKGLWETARLYGFVRKGRWKEAALFYVGKAGFKIPCGGISMELASLALDQQTLPSADKAVEQDAAQRVRGKHWPSTHAINLMIKALVNVCVEAKDFARLSKVYEVWKDASLPSKTLDEEDSEALTFEQWPPSQRPSSHTFDPFLRAFGRLEIDSHSPSTEEDSQARGEKQSWGSSQRMLDILRDMTETFRVRPSISSWTIALECLAREGRERWTSTTDILARAVGINTYPLSSSSERVTGAQANFPSANLATYTALIHALIRVSHQDGGCMTEQAAAVRDDLLGRTTDLNLAVRGLEDEEGFWKDLLDRWETVLQAKESDDRRRTWDAVEVLRANGGRTAEALRELWLIEREAGGGEGV